MAFDLPTNFTLLNGSTGSINGIGSLFQYASIVTGGWFGTGIVMMIFIISFAASAMMNITRAFTSASFIAMVFSVYFARIHSVPSYLPFAFLIVTIISVILSVKDRESY